MTIANRTYSFSAALLNASPSLQRLATTGETPSDSDQRAALYQYNVAVVCPNDTSARGLPIR